MTPNKKIYNHSFLGGLGKLKFFDEDGNPLFYKTQTYMEAGFIFVPYIPLIEEPTEFKPRRSLRSRYARTTVNNNYFEIVTVGTP